MPFCDQCGAENPDWARFCDQCGNPLTPRSAPADASPPATGVAGMTGAEASPGPTGCPQCGASVIPGEAFCDTCGTPLISFTSGTPGVQAGSIPPQQQYPAPQPWEMPSSAPVSAAPGVPGAMPGVAPAATARTTFESAHLVLPTRNVTLPLPATTQVFIGRADAVSGFYPDIDLTPYGALESGVGRRHLRLFIQQGQMFAEDMDSTNGTFINNQRVTPHAPQPITAADDLRLGTLALRIQV